MSSTLFKQVDYNLEHLINSIHLGQIGLPDIQRPFVWPNAKVRDLFDSMYRGYPVGYLLFWENGFKTQDKAIGTGVKQKAPDLLIVDGQQRLTSLFAVVRGVPVVRQNYQAETIEIAFNPLQERFEVADAAVRRDKAFIPNITTLWDDGVGLFASVRQFVSGLAETRELTPAEGRQIEEALTRLYNLQKYPFTALELSKDIDEEQVAEVFVRVNSKGKPLNQADFILTLMSVFWDDGRTQLEDFCRAARQPSSGEASPFNHYIQPDPDQLLRVAVGDGFRRARLQHVYSILRGKDLDTGQFSADRRDTQFEVLKRAQARTLHLRHWHDYFRVLARAGIVGGRMISSNSNLLYTYVLYLIGRTDFAVEEAELRRVVAKWFFMSSLTGRYTGSPESAFEFDLARFRDVRDAGDFVAILDRVCDSTLTSDFWSISLPNELATSSPRSPSLYAYYASLVLLHANALFSDQKVARLMDPSVHAGGSAFERHHLFPKAYLARLGVTETRDTNQIANYAIVERRDNELMADRAPAEYLPDMLERVRREERVNERDLAQMYYWHALPDGWENLDYRDFLERRRELIARVTADAYGQLAGAGRADEAADLSVEALVAIGEGTAVEFKSTMRVNLHTGERDPRIEHACLRTIAGFLNTGGGTLIIGIADDGTAVGIERDSFPSEDAMSLHLVNLIRSRIGAEYMMYIHPRFDDYRGRRVLTIDCYPARSAVFLRDGKTEQFHVRTGPSTTELSPSQTQEYIRQRGL